MVRKILIFIILVLVLLGVLGLFNAIKYRDGLRQQRQAVKAPDVDIRFIEGWNNQQIADYLQQKGITNSADFLAAQKSFDTSLYPELSDKPKNQDLEGYIFPDTYLIPANPASGINISNIILTKALDNFSVKFTAQIQADAKKTGLDIYQIITLASIIEKESGGNQDDRDTIAGIFYNRLNAGMPLQSDATIAFITGRAAVNNADTQIDSPYNTYAHTGLPAGPICNPSLGSIMAAVYPHQTDYLYFLTDPATSRAVFAKTYDQHLANKQKYLK